MSRSGHVTKNFCNNSKYPDGDDVDPISAVASPGRGSVVRTRDRYLPWGVGFELALASGRGFRSDKRRDALPVARGRSRRCDARSFRHQTARSLGCASTSEVRDKTLWSAERDHYGPPAIVTGSDERDWECRWPEVWPLAEKPHRKLTSAVSKAGRGDVENQGCKNLAEVYRRSCFTIQPFQSRPPSQQPLRLQTEPLLRTGRVASVGGM